MEQIVQAEHRENRGAGVRETLRIAGAYVAWVIGSGFATGQEILQFFSSYGKRSFLVLAADLIGFYLVGRTLMLRGFERRDADGFGCYAYYCGEKVGKLYAYGMPVVLFLGMAVLISAGGATLQQYYGLPRIAGTAVMAALALGTYLMGLDRLVRVISLIGPAIIAFTVLVGGASAIRDAGAWRTLAAAADPLEGMQTAPHWVISAILYLSLNYVGGSVYYSALGMTASRRSSVTRGAAIGTLALILSIGLVNAGILFNRDAMAGVAVPTLYLAERMSPAIGAAFSAVLALGIFSSSSAMLWSVCSGLFPGDRRKNRLASAGVSIAGLLIGFLPFEGLMAVVYPLTGYLGIWFLVRVFSRIRRDGKSIPSGVLTGSGMERDGASEKPVNNP